ncbi:MAG: GNAT family N-acetyltransferase [Chloroflexi bacterium]|nr:GNAT family N-acetyltransferase [Chloroflexota bacterium]
MDTVPNSLPSSAPSLSSTSRAKRASHRLAPRPTLCVSVPLWQNYFDAIALDSQRESPRLRYDYQIPNMGKKERDMPTRYIYSFGEPINPEDLHRLLQQTDWAQKRDPLDIQYMLDHSQLTLGVWDEERLIAFARVITDDHYRALIDDVVVDGDYRGRGIATQMLEKMLKRLEHIEQVMLDCDLELVPFYARFGFSQKECAAMLRDNRHNLPATTDLE